MRQVLFATSAALALSASFALAQGVPTYDGSQLHQLVLQLEHMAEDLNVQLEQLLTMQQELETELSQLLNLEEQLASLVEGSGVGELFAAVEDFERLQESLMAPLETAEALASGDYLDDLEFDDDFLEQIEAALTGTGLTSDDLSTLSDSEEPADNRIATSAGASTMLSVAAQQSHEDAGESLERLETMVGLIEDQDGLKSAVDLNTRVTAELGIILTQIWRLEAAQGVSAGQLGVVDAATLAAERKFRQMEVPE